MQFGGTIVYKFISQKLIGEVYSLLCGGGRFRKPERCFNLLASFIPQYVTAVLDIGCANGKNFSPFTKLELYGIDIVAEGQIAWVKKPRYRVIKIEDFTDALEKSDVDLRNLLIISNVTLLLLTKNEQLRFFNAAKERGCKNFIFTEPLRGKSPPALGYFELDERFFIQKRFLEFLGRNEKVTFILLDIPKERKKEILEMRTALSLRELDYIWFNREKIIRRRFWYLAGWIRRIIKRD